MESNEDFRNIQKARMEFRINVSEGGNEMEDILKDMGTSLHAYTGFARRAYRLLEETPPHSTKFPAVFFTYRDDDGLHLAHDSWMFLSEMPMMIHLRTIEALRDFFADLTKKDVRASLGMVELPAKAPVSSDLIDKCKKAAQNTMLAILTL